jgi:uncharacterized protein
MLHDPLALLIAGLAAAVAGAINALAGGGTLVSFPALTALGLAAVSANVTNTLALLPGYLGGAWAQRSALARPDQRRLLLLFLPAAVLGGLAGALFLLATGERTFRTLVPFLILAAVLLLGFGERIKRALAAASLARRGGRDGGLEGPRPWAVAAVGIASVYGGYFGAGVSVIILAVLAIAIEGPLNELSALKQAISLACNLSAALFFAFSGRVDWGFALVMAVGALCGGAIGGRLAGKMRPGALRAVVVVAGLAASAYYFFFKG